MIWEVTERNLELAAKVYTLSWKESHKNFCTREFLDQHTLEFQKNFLQTKLRQGSKLYMMLEKKPVGVVAVCQDQIDCLYILPSEQRKGYGTSLLRFAVQRCQGIPCLWVLNCNTAYSFYRKNGFFPTGRVRERGRGLAELELAYTEGI